jgi:hypothetical protein
MPGSGSNNGQKLWLLEVGFSPNSDPHFAF